MDLLPLYNLIIDSKYQEAIQQITSYPEDDSEISILKALCYLEQRKFEPAFDIIDLVYPKLTEINNHRLSIAYYVIKLYLFFRYKKFDQVEDLILLGNKEIEEIQLVMDQQKDETELEQDNIWIGYFYNIIAIIRYAKGMHREALKYHELSMKYRKRVSNTLLLGQSLSNIGVIFVERGEFEVGLGYFTQALDQIGDKQDSILYANVMYNTGICEYYVGNIDVAEEYLNSSIQLFARMEIDHSPTLPTLYIILCRIEREDYEKALHLLGQLEDVYEETKLRIVKLHRDIAKALYLKAQLRFINRATAQQILKSIIDDEILELPMTRLSMINLAELLLEEYAVFGNNESILEFETIIGTLFQMAQQQDSHTMQIEVMILQAKFAVINGNKKISKDYLSKAYKLARIHNREKLIEKVNRFVEYVEGDELNALLTNGTSNENKQVVLNYLNGLGTIIKEMKS